MHPLEAQRQPQQTGTPRMQALARLPIFLDLDDKRALVAGNGAPVAWKAEVLSAAGLSVEVFQCPSGGALAEEPRTRRSSCGAGMAHGGRRGAAVAVGGFENDADAERFAAAARAAGVPVNVIDRPAHCDFSFGAIVNRSPLVIGISTDGAAPVFAQAIRAKLEAMIPRGFARWAEAARRWRKLVQSPGLSPTARRRFWQLFAACAINHPAHERRKAISTHFRRRRASRGRRHRDSGGHWPWRSGAAHVARGARAANGGHYLDRRAGLAGHSRLCAARGEEDAGR
jgi:uroporphyrin-III C-methyltransferase/precorrin-2 dehydrogenase/sirohydrochlorin ferrochelatase